MAFAFFGTPEFAVGVLDRLENLGQRPEAVISQPDRPQGRGRKLAPTPTRVWAEAHGIPVLQPEKLKEQGFERAFGELAPEICLVAAFGQIIPRAVLAVPRLGFINVHPSLIPRYRGAAPMQWALIHGDAETGVSILQMTPRLDDGPILAQQAVPLPPDETAQSLCDRLSVLGGSLAAEVLRALESGPVQGRLQDESQVTWAPVLEKSDGELDWRMPARDLHNRIRGVQPWPGAHTTLAGLPLLVHRAAVVSADAPPGVPGAVVRADADALWVRTGDGVLGLLEIQAQGKRRLDARAFMAGRKGLAGTVLGSR